MCSSDLFTITFIGEGDKGETLFRISEAASGDRIADIKARYHLTDREAEVLHWIARGKSNRDIASILGLSPRTIGKEAIDIGVQILDGKRPDTATILIAPKLVTRDNVDQYKGW